MGSIAKLLEEAPEPKRIEVVIGTETFVFCAENPGEVVGAMFGMTEEILDRRAKHYTQITKGKVSAQIVRLASLISSALEGTEKAAELDLVRLFLKRPGDFMKLGNAAQEAVGFDPESPVDPVAQAGAGNSEGAAAPV